MLSVSNRTDRLRILALHARRGVACSVTVARGVTGPEFNANLFTVCSAAGIPWKQCQMSSKSRFLWEPAPSMLDKAFWKVRSFSAYGLFCLRSSAFLLHHPSACEARVCIPAESFGFRFSSCVFILFSLACSTLHGVPPFAHMGSQNTCSALSSTHAQVFASADALPTRNMPQPV